MVGHKTFTQRGNPFSEWDFFKYFDDEVLENRKPGHTVRRLLRIALGCYGGYNVSWIKENDRMIFDLLEEKNLLRDIVDEKGNIKKPWKNEYENKNSFLDRPTLGYGLKEGRVIVFTKDPLQNKEEQQNEKNELILFNRLSEIKASYSGRTADFLSLYEPELYNLAKDTGNLESLIEEGVLLEGAITEEERKMLKKAEENLKKIQLNEKRKLIKTYSQAKVFYLEYGDGRSRSELSKTDFGSYRVLKPFFKRFIEEGIMPDKSHSPRYRIESLEEKMVQTEPESNVGVNNIERKRRPSSFFEKETLRKYVIDNFSNCRIPDMMKKDFSAYSGAIRKGLIIELDEQGVFAGCHYAEKEVKNDLENTTKQKKKIIRKVLKEEAKIKDWELVRKLKLGISTYKQFRRNITHVNSEITMTTFPEKDPVAYDVASKRYFLEKLVEDGTIKDDREKRELI